MEFKKITKIILKLSLLPVTYILLFGFVGVSQIAIIKGTVVDESGNPLLGTTVLVEGTTNGVTTDFDGNYVISAVARTLHWFFL